MAGKVPTKKGQADLPEEFGRATRRSKRVSATNPTKRAAAADSGSDGARYNATKASAPALTMRLPPTPPTVAKNYA
jgi:hypothetical protein